MGYKIYEQQEFEEWVADAMIDQDISEKLWGLIDGNQVNLNVEDLGEEEAKLTVEVILKEN